MELNVSCWPWLGLSLVGRKTRTPEPGQFQEAGKLYVVRSQGRIVPLPVLDFKLFGRTALVVNNEFGLLCNPIHSESE